MASVTAFEKLRAEKREAINYPERPNDYCRSSAIFPKLLATDYPFRLA